MSVKSQLSKSAYLRQLAAKQWNLGDEYAVSARRMSGAEPRNGHRFEVSVTLDGSPLDRSVTVWAYDLPEALHKAAAMPLATWWDEEEGGRP